LLVQPSGSLLWRFRYRVFGVERKLSLGSFPEVSLKDARLARDAARAQVIDGENPVEDNRQRRIQAEVAAQTTFKVVADEYIQKMEREGRSPATIKKARWFLELLAEVAKRPIAAVSTWLSPTADDRYAPQLSPFARKRGNPKSGRSVRSKIITVFD
jgi:predicted phage gp36 major capsid-like protein